jgi:hypothetical protein
MAIFKLKERLYGLPIAAEILDLPIFWGALSNDRGLVSKFSSQTVPFPCETRKLPVIKGSEFKA